MTDYYQILGVTKTATEEEIKKAYRTLVKKYHPDVATDKKTAEEKFKEISAAYETLSDPQKRANYDNTGIAPNFEWDQFTRWPDLNDIWNDMAMRWMNMDQQQIFGRRPTKGNCPDCDGTGQKRIQNSYSNGPNQYISIVVRPCDKCGGSGNVR